MKNDLFTIAGETRDLRTLELTLKGTFQNKIVAQPELRSSEATLGHVKFYELYRMSHLSLKGIP